MFPRIYFTITDQARVILIIKIFLKIYTGLKIMMLVA